ncbi:MAG: pentapeptide repeat-containing protein [Candidatus Aenigmarchaeota archaeon]|nr:pentapeptide repeat-containing protein [Candidatus Aenigmarchaeota archaeon]
MSGKTIVPLQDILKRYKKGERKFIGIKCSGVDFNDLDISGADFSDSDLSYSNFDGSDLSDCNFSGCNMEWSSFRRTNLTRASFEKTNLTYCDFSNAIFENASLRNADLSWSIAFNTNIQSADTKGAMIATVAFDVSHLTREGLENVQMRLAKMKSQIPYELHLLLRFAVSAVHEKAHLNVQQAESRSSYARFNSGSGNLAVGTENNLSYSASAPYAMSAPYKGDTPYKTDKKKKDDRFPI